jgi:filamentous hemagglutinin family protein
MKRRLSTPLRPGTSRLGFAAVNAHHTNACSVTVLIAAGALTCSTSVWAQSAGTILPSGTLPVLRSVVSGQAFVNQPTANSNGSGRLLTIDQKSSRAIIDWRSFNIGNGSEVRFNQPGTTASVLNRIYNADPSIIQGRLTSAGPIDPVTKLPTAGGQIILINQNDGVSWLAAHMILIVMAQTSLLGSLKKATHNI